MALDRLLIFTTDLYKGGIAAATLKYANSLSSEYDVKIVVWDNLEVLLDVPSNIDIYQINCPLGANFGRTKLNILKRKLLRLLSLPFVIVKFILLVKQIKPSMIFSLGYLPNILTLLITKVFKNIKIIVSERTSPQRDLENSGIKGRLVVFVAKRLYKYADRILTPSIELKDEISQLYNLEQSKVVGISNYFDLDEIRSKMEEEISSNEGKEIFNSNIIVTCGRLSRQKGQWFLIRSIAPLLIDNPGWKLVFLGDGELLDFLQKMTRDLKIDKQVIFMGNVKNPYKYIAQSQLFAFSSLWEGFPNALVEAMACKISVVAADCPTGPREILLRNDYPSEFFVNKFPNVILDSEKLIPQELQFQKAIERNMLDPQIREQLAKQSVRIAKMYSKKKVEKDLIECLKEI